MARPAKGGKRIVLVSNSLSTSNQRDLPRVREVLARYPHVRHLEGDNLPALFRQLETFKTSPPDLLLLNGGDGTIHSALTFLLNKKIFKKLPPIAVLAGGMTNLVAKDLGTGGRAAPVLERVLTLYEAGEINRHLGRRNLVRVDFEDGESPQYGLFWGAALVTNAILYCRERLYPKGIKGKPSQIIAFLAMARSFFTGIEREGSVTYVPPATIRKKGGTVREGRYAGIMTTTLKHLLFGTKAPVKPGSLPFFTMDLKVSALMASFYHGLRGTVHQANADGISLTFEKKVTLEAGVPFTMDGEVFTPATGTAITLSCAPALTFVSFSGD